MRPLHVRHVGRDTREGIARQVALDLAADDLAGLLVVVRVRRRGVQPVDHDGFAPATLNEANSRLSRVETASPSTDFSRVTVFHPAGPVISDTVLFSVAQNAQPPLWTKTDEQYVSVTSRSRNCALNHSCDWMKSVFFLGSKAICPSGERPGFCWVPSCDIALAVVS